MLAQIFTFAQRDRLPTGNGRRVDNTYLSGARWRRPVSPQFDRVRTKEARMSYYLMQVAYNPEGWQVLVKNPQNRVEAVRPAIEGLGGKIENAWYSFGEYDVTLIVQMPDNISAAALSITFAAGGALKTVKTTPLLTATEAMEAMKRAGTAGYRAASAG
jgi:uncharacterized protein with GYD domain